MTLVARSSYVAFQTTHYTCSFFFFFFNDTATTEIYTLSLHDALPISRRNRSAPTEAASSRRSTLIATLRSCFLRSEEHTSELQSRENLVCRLLLEKKKKTNILSTSQTCRHTKAGNTTPAPLYS